MEVVAGVAVGAAAIDTAAAAAGDIFLSAYSSHLVAAVTTSNVWS